MAGELVGEVSDPGVAGTNSFGYFESAFEAEVGDVSAATDAIDDEVVKVLKLGEFFISNMVHVCAVGYISETVSKNRQLEMSATDRDDFNSINAERVLVNQVNVPFWGTWIAVLSEGIRIFLTEGILYVFLTIYLCRGLFKVVEGADIIETSGVVFVIVCQENGVQMSYSCTKHLLTEIRTGINKKSFAAIVHKDAGAQSLITWI